MGLLGSRRRRGGLLRFLHRVFERRAGVGPAGEVAQVEKQKRRIRLTSNVRVNTCGILVLFFPPGSRFGPHLRVQVVRRLCGEGYVR